LRWGLDVARRQLGAVLGCLWAVNYGLSAIEQSLWAVNYDLCVVRHCLRAVWHSLDE